MAAGGRVAHLIRTRRLYTGEPYGALKAGTIFDNSTPIPSAATSAQALLESKIFSIFGDYGEWLAHPLGIARVRIMGMEGGLAIWLDSHAELHPICREPGVWRPGKIYRFSQTLAGMLLPHAHRDEEMTGIPQLRIVSVRGRNLTVSLVGTSSRLTLCGVPGTRWVDDIEEFRSSQGDSTETPIWLTPALTSAEKEFEDMFPRVTANSRQLAWLGSGLLRRVALFHTTSSAYRTRFWINPDRRTGGEWVFELTTRQDVAVDHDGFLARLLDPVWGLPLRIHREFCMCDVDASWGRECTYDLMHVGGERGVLQLRFVHARRYQGGQERQDFAAIGSDEGWLDRVLPEPPGIDAYETDELRERRRKSLVRKIHAD
ncbi:hypothetical protein ABZ942_35065 [Nocardia sp. NPDC046473]|uniref:hypothetical protein n=1 Tax=Nocardia sp. NPDC046473 TaxID=3155733 RepID=UPI0033E3A44F